MPTVELLRDHLARLAEERALGGEGWNAEQLLFCSERGTQMNPSNLNRQFDGILKRAKLPQIRFHDLRHTYAALSIAAGVDIYALSRLMGHSTITVTANRYGHLYDETKQQAADRVDALLRKVG